MWQLWRVRRGRKAAVAAIMPLVAGSRYRLNGIADSAWLEPYAVGFLSMLITLEATRCTGRLGSQALGLVQAEAWAQITGLDPELIGEEICLLSLNRNAQFGEGCGNAVAFFETLSGWDVAAEGLDDWDDILRRAAWAPRAMHQPPHESLLSEAQALSLWTQHFEAHLDLTPMQEGSRG